MMNFLNVYSKKLIEIKAKLFCRSHNWDQASFLKPVQYFGTKPLRQNMDAAWEKVDVVQNNVFLCPKLKVMKRALKI